MVIALFNFRLSNTYFFLFVFIFTDIFLISTFLPMMLPIKANKVKMNDIILDPITRDKCYTFDFYVDEIKRLLPKYEELGYFKDL